MAKSDDRDDRIVNLELGLDLFEAQVIAESVRAAGYHVHLREMTTEGIPLGSQGVRQLLMVRADDLEPVREIIDRSFATE